MINKICTSIEQSKDIGSRILPPESADMYWWSSGKRYYVESMDDGDFNEKGEDIRAWSLAALQDIIKINYKLEKTLLDQSDYFTYSLYDSDDPTFRTSEYDNPVDACVEMILKLHERKLL